jgi:DNA (cytosine-5)-methyltransferase 1
VDLFAGCGGLSLGIERSGGVLRLAVEKSDMAAHTFYANFIDDTIDECAWAEHVRAPVADQARAGVAVATLRTVLDSKVIIDSLTRASLDVVVGGPPCQGFSLAGLRNPDDIRNKLPWEYLEFVKQTSPKMVIIENVVGMNHTMAKGEQSPFVQLQQALRETAPGYEVQGLAVNALHYGAPQNRPRLMIVGIRKDVSDELGIHSTGKLWKSGFIGEVDQVPPLAPRPTVSRAKSPTIADAIGDLQTVRPAPQTSRAANYRAFTRTRVEWGLPPSRRRTDEVTNQEQRVHTEATQQRFRLYQWLRENGLHPRLLSELSKAGHAGELLVEHAIRDAEFPAQSPDGTILGGSPTEMVELMVRLKTRKHTQKALGWDEPAPTVVTLPDDYVHPSEPRTFTVREMARFQGFPDDFEFRGKVTTGSLRRRFEVPQYSQVGNAVSPFLALAVGKMIARVLESKDEQITLTDASTSEISKQGSVHMNKPAMTRTGLKKAVVSLARNST